MKEKLINWLIKVTKADTNKISDGYHTFGELYEHRIALFIRLLNLIPCNAWRSLKHSDGTMFDGWFVAGYGVKKGHQVTYHLPIKEWKLLNRIVTFDKAPKWDGHTPNDVLERLKNL